MKEPGFIIELHVDPGVATCDMEGEKLSGEVLEDLLDCVKPGDAEDACKYVLRRWNPEFRIVKQIDGKWQNVIADASDKKAICEAIYFESETDFSDEDVANMYLIWEAADSTSNEQED